MGTAIAPSDTPLSPPPSTSSAAEASRPDAPARSVALDVLRGAAALMVLVWHAYPVSASGDFAPGWGLAFADTGLGQGGVTLFFVLSGFLIGGPFLEARLGLRRAPNLRAYALRRAARIVPAYWLALVGMTGVLGYFSLQAPTGKQLILHALFVQNWVPGEANGFFPPGWTLGVEALFYVVLPLGVLGLLRTTRPDANGLGVAIGAVWLMSSVCGFIAWGWFTERSIGEWGTIGPNSLPATLFLFCPGLLIAVARAAPKDNRVASALTWLRQHALVSGVLMVGAFTLACACELPGNNAVLELRYQALMVAAGLLVNLALGWRTAWRGGLGVFAALGRWSYGIYLWHYPVARAVSRTGLTPPATDGILLRWAVFGLAVALLTIPLAAASWYVVERPLIARAQAWRPGGLRGRAQPALSLGDG